MKNERLLDYQKEPLFTREVAAVSFEGFRVTRPALYEFLVNTYSFCINQFTVTKHWQGHYSVILWFIDPLSWENHTVTVTSTNLTLALKCMDEIMLEFVKSITTGAKPPKPARTA